MPTAKDGLRLGASRDSLAIADATADQIVAALNDDQKAALAASLAPNEPERPNADDGADSDDKGRKNGKKEGEEEEPASDAADPSHVQYGLGFAAATERMGAVFASEEFTGREALAAELLGLDASIPASKIIGSLAKAKKGEAAGGDNADLLAALRHENQDLGAEGADDAKASAPADLMKGAHAKVKERRGKFA